MWALLIGLVVIGVLMSVTALSTRTVAVTRTKAEVQNATVHVAAPPGMKAFPAALIPLPRNKKRDRSRSANARSCAVDNGTVCQVRAFRWEVSRQGDMHVG